VTNGGREGMLCWGGVQPVLCSLARQGGRWPGVTVPEGRKGNGWVNERLVWRVAVVGRTVFTEFIVSLISC
jgi:hypothetical protein